MKTFAVIASLLIFVASASGAIVIPDSATAIAEFWQNGPVLHTYDQVDIVAQQHIGIVYDGTIGAPTFGSFDRMTGWGGAMATTPLNGTNEGNTCRDNYIYTFNNPVALDDLIIWNPGGASWIAGKSLQDVYIEYSTVAAPTTTADWVTVYDGALTLGPTIGDYVYYDPTDVIDMGNVSGIRHVAISAMNSYYNAASTYGMIAEVQFVLVPEPVTVVVLALGAGLALLRRRR